MPSSFVEIILFVIAAWLAFFLPGAAWQAWERPTRRDALEWIAESAGISVAASGMLALVFSWLGLQLSGWGLAALGGLVLIAWLSARLLRGASWRLSATGLLAAAVLLALAAWRFWQARDLALPAWVDSVHHTLLVRLISENGGLPASWQPYLPTPFFYHFGFHLISAVFGFFAQLDPARAVLGAGQVISALVALSVYRLAKVLWADWRRAGLAAVLVGFVFTMPAYYLTWGRYTLLAGVLVLPLAMAAALEVRACPANRWGWARLALYTASLTFCHFLAVGLLALFFLVLGIAEARSLLLRRASGGPGWRAALRATGWQPFGAAALGILAALPWILNVWLYSQRYARVDLADPFDPGKAQALKDSFDYFIYLTGPVRSQILLLIGAAGMLLGIARPNRRRLAGWALLVSMLALPVAPRFAPFRWDHLAIVLFLPGALFVSDLLVTPADWLARRWRRLSRIALGTAALALLAWGVVETRDILNPVTVFVERRDLPALQWVQENTPQSARFFINAVPWQGRFYRGVDGGFWIMPVTGRFTVAPPVAYGWGDAPDIDLLSGWAGRASQVKACDETFWDLVRDARLSYVYIRQGPGSLQPGGLEGCAGLKLVYTYEGVYIYALTGQ